MQAVLTLPASTRSPRAGRRFIEEHLTAWGLPDVCDTAVMLVSELVTNAVLHARSKSRLIVTLAGTTLRVLVIDDDRRLPAVHQLTHDSTGRRGLALVEALADEWGVEELPTGKTVWFALRVPLRPAGRAGRGAGE